MADRSASKMKRKFLTESAKKRTITERKKKWDQRRVSLGVAAAEWDRERTRCFMTNPQFAKHLLYLHSRFCNYHIQPKSPAGKVSVKEIVNIGLGSPIQNTDEPGSSTPVQSAFRLMVTSTPKSKGLPQVRAKHLSVASSIGPVSPTTEEPGQRPSTPSQPAFHLMMTSTPKSAGLPQVRVVDLESGDEDDNMGQDDSDTEPDYVSSLFSTRSNVEVDDAATADILFNFEDDIELEGEDLSKIPQPGDLKLHMTEGELVSAPKCITYNASLQKLVQYAVGTKCQRCGAELRYRHVTRGTCLVIVWECTLNTNHKGTWSSQPRLHQMYACNLLLPSCLLLSGNNYSKVALMAKFLNLNFVSEANFYRIQDKYVAPTVDRYWEDSRQRLLNELRDPVILCGDGSNDSPGHCAQYCTYSLMDFNSHHIVGISIKDCREVGFKSVNMERQAFFEVMDDVQRHVNVREIVTDAHVQIKASLKHEEKYQGITHQFDVWHVIKNVSKKLCAAGKERGCRDLLQWIPSIRNHLWHAAQKCDGNVECLKETWVRCVHHICNRHTWIDTTGITSGRCEHPVPLPEDERNKPWLPIQSKATDALRRIVFDKTLLGNLHYIRNFRHTSELELFHSHLLMYCPKRNAYTYTGYKLRNQLAAIDYNKHVNRPVSKMDDGSIRHVQKFSKATNRWTAYPKKEPKEYLYIGDMLRQIVECRELRDKRLDARVERSADDPRNIQPSRDPVPKPPMADSIKERECRHQKS